MVLCRGGLVEFELSLEGPGVLRKSVNSALSSVMYFIVSGLHWLQYMLPLGSHHTGVDGIGSVV